MQWSSNERRKSASASRQERSKESKIDFKGRKKNADADERLFFSFCIRSPASSRHCSRKRTTGISGAGAAREGPFIVSGIEDNGGKIRAEGLTETRPKKRSNRERGSEEKVVESKKKKTLAFFLPLLFHRPALPSSLPCRRLPFPSSLSLRLSADF